VADLVFLCPQERDREAVGHASAESRDVVFVGDDLDAAGEVDLDEIVRACAAHQPRGVVGTKDLSALLAALVCARLGLSGPSPKAVINCQHKLWSREIQRRVVPEATPHFAAVGADDVPPFPFFAKPVVGRLSDSAMPIQAPSDLDLLDHDRPYARAYEAIAVSAGVLAGQCGGFIAEEILEENEVTLEGFVHHGQVTVVGITDSINYEGTASFERFDYPTALGDSRRRELSAVARRLLPALGFDGGFFNIEFFVPAVGPAKIVEVNGRIASQFSALLELTHGYSSYDALMSLAVGERPDWPAVGPTGFALSYCLRVFEDALVETVPQCDGDVELLVQSGSRLSEQGTNDAESYRLCIFVESGTDRAATIAAARARAAGILSGFRLSPPRSLATD